MQVKCSKYPSIVASYEKQTFQFVNGLCEIPDEIALKLTFRSDIYTMVGSSFNGDKSIHPFNPTSWNNQKRIVWDGPIGYNNGYGKGSMMLIEGLDKLVDISVITSKWQGSTDEYISDNLKRILEKNTPSLDAFYLMFFPAWEFTRKVSQRFVGYTMLEASRIPQSWVDNCNKLCERVIVPCEHQRKAFIESGVKVDVKSIPLGIIPEMFPVKPDEEPSDDEFWFGTMGTLTYRKGTDILINAFFKAFPRDKFANVKLFIKTLPSGGVGSMWFIDKELWRKNQDRIVLNYDSFSPEELITDFFHTIDCFVFPTRGEGFGLPPLEAMATGLPVICTKYSGCEEFMDPAVSYPLDYTEVDVPIGDWRGYPEALRAPGQKWAEPDEDHLVELMLEVYNNQKKAKAKGKKAAAYVRKNFTADISAKKLVDYLDSKF